MGLRPAKCYRNVKRPYTRSSKKRSKNFVKGAPDPKIRRFEMGNSKKNFSLNVNLVTKQSVQIRHNALEAVRMATNKFLNDAIGKENYFFKVLIYPHQILRENPLATGAGADRYQTGMRKSFGKPIGTAAIVKKNQKILLIRIDENKKEIAKKALKIAGAKLPTTCDIVYKLNEH